MLESDLFTWWVISISWSIVFLVLVSIYLYRNSKNRREKSNQETRNIVSKFVKDFVFVWVLISLLAFYVVSVNIGSSAIFAGGNIVVEIILIIYLIKTRKDSEQIQRQDRNRHSRFCRDGSGSSPPRTRADH